MQYTKRTTPLPTVDEVGSRLIAEWRGQHVKRPRRPGRMATAMVIMVMGIMTGAALAATTAAMIGRDDADTAAATSCSDVASTIDLTPTMPAPRKDQSRITE